MAVKTILAGVLGTGIIISGVAWTGQQNIDSIRTSVGNLQNKLTQSIKDNQFLTGAYDNLKLTYNGAVGTANSTINNMKIEREKLQGQIEDLTKQVNDLQAQGTAGQTEMQTEVDRLQGEITKANTAVATLDTDIKAIDSGATYTAINQTNYTVTPQAIDTATTPFITDQAMAFNATGAKIMVDPKYTTAIQAEYLAKGMDFTIIGVDTYTDTQTYLSYVVRPKVSTIMDIYSQGVNDVLMAYGKGSVMYLYFENIDGVKVGRGQLQ